MATSYSRMYNKYLEKCKLLDKKPKSFDEFKRNITKLEIENLLRNIESRKSSNFLGECER